MLTLGLATIVFLPNLASATPPADPVSEYDHFVIYRGANGDVVCREATPLEARQLDQIKPTDLRQINHLEALKSGLSTEDLPQHLTIILQATANLDANAPAKAAFLRAAAAWENLISSPVTIYIEADFGPTNFGQSWPDKVLGSTSSPSLNSLNYSVVRNNLIAGANTPAKLAVYNALPGSSVPTDLGSSSSISVSNSIARAIGVLNLTAQSSEPKARIGFNSQEVTYDFDPSDGISGTDFESVATHEIGHALGFVSRNGQGTTIPAMWDLYRFRSGTTSGTFTTAQRIMTIGGPVPNSQYQFVPGDTELGLSNGGPDPDNDPNKATDNSDGNQSSHWRQASLNGNVYIGIMDPRIPANVHRPITANDTNALNIFGYNSQLLSGPANDNFTSAQTITGCSGSVNGSNLGASGEPGEPIHSPDDNRSFRSVWYQWQAPSTGNVTFTTAGSGFDTVLAVYTGNSVGSLTLIGRADDNSNTDKTSTVTFAASAGTFYRIAVDGYNNGPAGGSGGDVGLITLNWNASNCTATATIQILLEQSGPAADQAAVIDSVNWLRDPFLVVNPGNLINPASDPNTRVVILVSNLPSGSVVVNLTDSNNQSYDIPAQDVRTVPNFDFQQVTFRLPSNLPAGTCRIRVTAQGQFSNTATFRIRT